MRAIKHDRYGSPDVLELREVAKPEVRDGEVLVRVVAAGLHVGDSFGVRGAPFAMRVVSGLFRPKRGIPGFDLAGRVEAVGGGVEGFRVGDEVFGAHHGTCAEYVSARANELALKPASLSFEEAAAIPTSGFAALRGLRDVGKVQPGQRVLINGASGGVGTFAVQIAKALGAEVTAVCSATNAELVRSIGADHVIDYGKEDFTRGDRGYELVLDNIENRSMWDCLRAVTPDGMLILNSGTGAHGFELLVRLFRPIVVNPFVLQKLRRYVSAPKHEDLVALAQLVESGKLRSVIDSTYPLRDTAAALRHIEAGHVRGKVVVTL